MKNTLKTKFINTFGCEPNRYFDCGGRFEILGNHTDHNHGLCMAATCNLCISAAVKERDDNVVEVVSEGNPSFKINLNNLEVNNQEKFSSPALIRGIAKRFADLGYKFGGFTAYMSSTIYAGAGVSSSAAFELLIARIFNACFNDNKVTNLEMAKAGQFAENVYFGKKSGLLDQIGVGYGNISGIDFKDIENPTVKQVEFPFKDLHFYIVNTGGSHAELSDLYSAIPNDMYNAAKKMGHQFLIEGSLAELEDIKDKLTDIEYGRALHFYSENERVKKGIEALKTKNKELFLEQINNSRLSSTNQLKNMMVADNYEGSPLQACELAMSLLDKQGACKINGGGFAGSIICVVPDAYICRFETIMKQRYGDANVREVFVRETGPREF